MDRARVDSLINEQHGRFRVDRAVYSDQDIFDAEIARFFEGGWMYLAHESQIAERGQYFATKMGRQPVVLVRQRDGGIGGFINACAHRGATLVPFEQGRANTFTCRFHGWAYSTEGRCIKIKNEETGAYSDPNCREQFNLTSIARLESYRGFIFGSLNAEVGALADWLGPTRPWIDLIVDQSPQGLEIVRGVSTYTIRGNWKLQAENGVDGYHVSTVHRVFANTVAQREAKRDITGMQKTEAGRMTGQVNSGCYDFGNGHLAIWAQRTNPEVHPLWAQRERLEREFPADRVEWMLRRGRNLYLFPNVFLMDNPSSQVRTMQPISPDVCEVTVRCIAPVGESSAARAARLRKFEDFYLTTGMATSDDLAALESTHLGGLGRAARWNDYARGQAAVLHGAQDTDGAKIGSEPQVMTQNWDHEVMYHGFYRHWRAALGGTKS